MVRPTVRSKCICTVFVIAIEMRPLRSSAAPYPMFFRDLAVLEGWVKCVYGFSVAKAPYFKFKPTANKMSSKRKSSVKQALEMSIQEPTAKRNKRLSNDLNNSTLASPSNNELLKIEEPETKTNQPFKQISQSTFTSQSKSELEVRGQTVDQICKYITTTEMATIKATEGTVTTQAAT